MFCPSGKMDQFSPTLKCREFLARSLNLSINVYFKVVKNRKDLNTGLYYVIKMIKLKTVYSVAKHLNPKYDLELIRSIGENNRELGLIIGTGKSLARGYAVGTLAGIAAGNIASLVGADQDVARDIAQVTGTAIVIADYLQFMGQYIYEKFIK